MTCFTDADYQSFVAFSGDTNPLHADDDFARASGFDSRVVPGMLAVGRLLQDRQPPKTLRVRFYAPMYFDTEYVETWPEENHCWIGKHGHRLNLWIDSHIDLTNPEPGQSAMCGEFKIKHEINAVAAVLNWISYFVGTRRPGAGAILANAAIVFTGKDVRCDTLAYETMLTDHPELATFMIYAVLKAEGQEVARCEIQAFKSRHRGIK